MTLSNSSSLLSEATAQWKNRADDSRFTSLAELKKSVLKRKEESWTATPAVADLRIQPDGKNLAVEIYDPTAGQRRLIHPSNWSFNQLAQYAKAPASYMRSLPSQLAAINLQWGLEHQPMREESLVLARSNGDNELRAMTSTSYGRIWDHQIIEAVERVNQDGRWTIPFDADTNVNVKRATTLFASDRDVTIFMVDKTRPIEIPGKSEPLFRGFYASNSEVGAGVFGLVTFLYNRLCSNRCIYGLTEVKELRIRHTSGAPERFAYEGARYLRRYAEESPKQIVDAIVAASNTPVPVKEDQTVEDWLQKRGFTKGEAKASVASAVAEEGSARTLYEIMQGVTAFARSIPHQDTRTDLERRGGSLLSLVHP